MLLPDDFFDVQRGATPRVYEKPRGVAPRSFGGGCIPHRKTDKEPAALEAGDLGFSIKYYIAVNNFKEMILCMRRILNMTADI